MRDRHSIDELRALLIYDPVLGTLRRRDSNKLIDTVREAKKGPRFTLQGKRYYVRHVILAMLLGRWPKNREIHVKDPDPFNWKQDNFIFEPVDEKYCTGCSTLKPIYLFSKDRTKPDGRASRCKACYKPKVQPWLRADYNKSIERKYGITAEEYTRLFAEQGGRCAICRRHEDELRKRLMVDHCHSSGKVRGLLCFLCNTGLGAFKDSTHRLESAVDYLKT